MRFMVEDWDFRIINSEISKISKSNFKSFIIWLKLLKFFDKDFMFI